MKLGSASTFVVTTLMIAGTAGAQERTVLSDLQAANPVRMAREPLSELMAGARVERVSARGISQGWTNNRDGTFLINSINRHGKPFTEAGRWKVTDDGRFCIEIEWHNDKPEKWCRFVLKTAEGYFTANTGTVATEVVRRLDIRK